MGTYFGTSSNDYKAAHKERSPIIKRWKSWTMYGNDGDDILVGGPKTDQLIGGFGNDFLIGGIGSDFLSGEDGNDRILGVNRHTQYPGSGEYDTLYGGGGADIFELGDWWYGTSYRGDGYATIKDFKWFDGDKIQVSGNSGNYSLGYGNWSGTTALDTIIFFQGDAIAVMEDTTNIIISEDFIFA